jgi:hypothetical protein
MSEGCVAYPDLPNQDLCHHHARKAQPRGGMRLVADYTVGGAFSREEGWEVSIESLCSMHELKVLEYDPTVSESGNVDRNPQVVRKVSCHVKPIGAAQVVLAGNQISQEIDHNLWFDHDPQLHEGMAVLWEFNGVKTLLRITKVPVDLHGMGRLWSGGAIAKREDNLDINKVVDLKTLL